MNNPKETKKSHVEFGRCRDSPTWLGDCVGALDGSGVGAAVGNAVGSCVGADV